MRTNAPLVPSSSRGTALHPPKRDSVSSAVVPRTPPSAHDDVDSDEYDWLEEDVGPPKVARAYFGYPPSTQTTTVTTVTTTTTSFPALEIVEPSFRQQMDPKAFPLAAKPTPPFLRNIEFSLGRSRTTFKEEVTEQKPTLTAEHHSTNTNFMTTPFKPEYATSHNTEYSTHLPMDNTTHKRKRVKIDADDNSTSSHLLNNRLQYTFDSPTSPSHRALKETTPLARSSKSPQRRALLHNPAELRAQTLSPSREHNDDSYEMVDSLKRPRQPSPAGSNVRPRLLSPVHARLGRAPPLASTSIAPGSEQTLISPSLSPVTAAAQSGSERQDYFDRPALSSPPNEAEELAEFAKTLGSPLIKQQKTSKSAPSTQVRPPTMMDIPAMVSTFDAMPPIMKSYVMHQFLRRCPVQVLQFVANTVDPALRCDFVQNVPAEITEQIFGYLSVTDLCSAAQVSKRWRTAIDTNEKLWFNKCQDEQFRFSKKELHTAVQQGWGWQTSAGRRDPDKDWSRKTELVKKRPVWTTFDAETLLQKGHPNEVYSTAMKVEKAVALLQESNLNDLLRGGRYSGAIRLAMMARREIPAPKAGLPSLTQMHFWKSLCRRHYAVRAGWLDPKIKPSHLAIPASPNVITCLQFDEKRIVTAYDDKSIHMHSTTTGKPLGVLEGHNGGVWAMEFYGDTLVSGATDRSICVFDMNKMVCTHDFRGHSSTIRCLQIVESEGVSNDFIHDPTGSRPLIITGARDHTIKIWFMPVAGDDEAWRDLGDIEQHNPYYIRTLVGHTDSVRAFQAHGDIVVSGSYDCDVRVWRISTGEPLYRLEGHTNKVYSVVYDHENDRCISGSIDAQIKIWNLKNGTILHTCEGHTSLVGLLDYRADRLISASADTTLRIWDIDTGRCKATLCAHNGPITCFQHDNSKIISGSERNVKLWDINSAEFSRDLLADLTGLWRVNFDYRRCIAAVTRPSGTFIEIMDYGAWRDGVSQNLLGTRTVVSRDTISGEPRSAVRREADRAHQNNLLQQTETRGRMLEG